MAMPNTTVPGTALVHIGTVTVCCGLHVRGPWARCCANDDDCTPCCERCPTCPALALPDLFSHDWPGLAQLGELVDAMLKGRP
jgi:hypothetical protein